VTAPQRGGAENEVPYSKISFRAAARALTARDEKPEDEDDEKRRRKGDRDGDFQTLLLRRKFPRRAVNRYDSLNTTIAARTQDIAADAYEQAAALLEIALDSMNPYCEPDACVIEIGGIDDYQPPQDYYPLQL
jgi:hypothetical protein